VAETAETLIDQNVDFVTALRTTLTQSPNASASELEGAQRKYGELGTLVRQIENRTLKKLQTLPDAQQLREAS